jgi:hypothetical protein
MACCDGSGKGGYTRARLYMLKNDNPLAVSLGTHHNLSIYSALDGSYRGTEISISGWQLLSTNNISSGKSPELAQITIDPPIQLQVGSERTAFYLFASDEILLFGQGAYSI